MLFTQEELEAIRLADEELEREWAASTKAERKNDDALSKQIEEMAIRERMDPRQRTVTDRNRAYYEAHKDELWALQKGRYRQKQLNKKQSAASVGTTDSGKQEK